MRAQIDRARVLQLTREGLGCAQIALALGCSLASVSRIRLEHGVSSRKRQTPSPIDRLGNAEPIGSVAVWTRCPETVARWIARRARYIGCPIALIELDGQLRAALPGTADVRRARRHGRVLGDFGPDVTADALAPMLSAR